jgi:hypothetical protein
MAVANRGGVEGKWASLMLRRNRVRQDCRLHVFYRFEPTSRSEKDLKITCEPMGLWLDFMKSGICGRLQPHC